jgi:FkbM family methyltransferase
MKLLKKLLPEKVYRYSLDFYKNYFDKHFIKSYSQEGEDLILKRELEGREKGFYIDVGAYHPIRFSNTFLFYKLGWEGINIDARPGSMKLFQKFRKRDINLEIPISDRQEEMTFYTFNEPAVSGFLKDISLERAQKEGYKILREDKLKTETLASVLDKYLPTNTKIDFLTIDVEGLDYQVLISNNWKLYRPSIILCEMLGEDFEDITKSNTYSFLRQEGYKLFAKTANTAFFKL